MGRYYHGDINGKFWFGIQSSDAADRFGVIGQPPATLEYHFGEEHVDTINEELADILHNLGEHFEKLEQFFETHHGYTEAELCDYLGVESILRLRQLLSEYADYHLGKQILEQIEEAGGCFFEAQT